MYVLLTSDEKYVSEYLLNELILSDSISEALTFDDETKALRFKKILVERCQITCSVNTYIE